MLGRDEAHDAVPYFFSDLADWASMEYVGPARASSVVRGSLDDGEFTVFYLEERPRGGRAHRRALRRPRARAALHHRAAPTVIRAALAELGT